MTAQPEERPHLTLVVNKCGYGWGPWICDNDAHPDRPNEHWMVKADSWEVS